MGLRLLRSGPAPDLVLASTALRCRETWAALSAGLGDPQEIEVRFDAALYAASAERLLDVLAGVTAARTVLLIAHNPGVSQLAHDLARGDDEARAELRAGFAPAAIACFAIEGDWHEVSAATARLRRFDRSPLD